jgi:hypothetical protein
MIVFQETRGGKMQDRITDRLKTRPEFTEAGIIYNI